MYGYLAMVIWSHRSIFLRCTVFSQIYINTMLFVHFFLVGGIKINIVKFVWGSILNMLKLGWGGGLFLILSHHRIFSSPLLLVNNDCSLKSPTNLSLVIKPLDNWKNISRRLEICLSDVSVWMSSTMFRLNEDNI